jgi:DEAD/DEAH box helicase domain-containing protein
LSGLTELFAHISSLGTHRFIAFVDSRKQVEYLSAIMQRNTEGEEVSFGSDRLDQMNVLPFRAGYELQDRDRIQDRLSKGRLRGIVSTSALELGIDIPYLDIGILVGVPQSRTSLLQRIGRIGRHKAGLVLVVHRGDLQDEQAFRDAENFMIRPLSESSLYLENQRIQYLHALCLARHGGEHDQVAACAANENNEEFTSSCAWPHGFLALCYKERIGEVPTDLQAMKMEGGEDPNHIFPLRDVESQFQVELKQGPEQRSLGALSHGQVLREAYPGAVYYYIGQPYRVYRILQQDKKILVRRESHYTTKPQTLPTLVFPNLSQGNIHRCFQYSELTAIECNVQVREVIVGYKERRGANDFPVQYPLSFADTGIAFEIPRFTRNYFTTGVVLTHPVLSISGVKPEEVAKLVYEAFLSVVPFERQDVGIACDKHRVDRGPIAQGQYFIALYDQTYGSLRLSGRLLEDRGLQDVLETAIRLGETSGLKGADPLTFGSLVELHVAATSPPVSIAFGRDSVVSGSMGGYVEVILPGSKGIDIRHNNEEFFVEKVFYSPSLGGMAYRGKHVSVEAKDVSEVVHLESVIPIPGESRLGKYNPDTGELEEE